MFFTNLMIRTDNIESVSSILSPIINTPNYVLNSDYKFNYTTRTLKITFVEFEGVRGKTLSSTAEGRGRTDMRVASQWFLRPSRLPIPPLRLEKQNGAEDEIRTRDFLLGKEAFYH
jgi:hypothetical protein